MGGGDSAKKDTSSLSRICIWTASLTGAYARCAEPVAWHVSHCVSGDAVFSQAETEGQSSSPHAACISHNARNMHCCRRGPPPPPPLGFMQRNRFVLQATTSLYRSSWGSAGHGVQFGSVLVMRDIVFQAWLLNNTGGGEVRPGQQPNPQVAVTEYRAGQPDNPGIPSGTPPQAAAGRGGRI
eukprot:gene18044-biopygen18941